MANHISVLLRPLPLVAALVALTACNEPLSVTEWSPAEQPNQLQVTYSQVAQPVRFVANSERLASGERERLVEFGRRRGLSAGDRVEVVTGPSSETLARRRAQVTTATLNGAGMRFVTVAQSTDPDLPRDTVELRVGRHLVQLPPCPNWSMASNPNYGNRQGSNFGCATATNLGLMVADPADLLAGRNLGPSDGTQQVLSIQRYRSGTPTPLAASGAAENQASGPSQSQSAGTPAGGAGR